VLGEEHAPDEERPHDDGCATGAEPPDPARVAPRRRSGSRLVGSATGATVPQPRTDRDERGHDEGEVAGHERTHDHLEVLERDPCSGGIGVVEHGLVEHLRDTPRDRREYDDRRRDPRYHDDVGAPSPRHDEQAHCDQSGDHEQALDRERRSCEHADHDRPRRRRRAPVDQGQRDREHRARARGAVGGERSGGPQHRSAAEDEPGGEERPRSGGQLPAGHVGRE